MNDDVTAGRVPHSRHRRQPPTEEPIMSRGDSALVLAMHDHLDRCFPGAEVAVLHERISPIVHLDVVVVRPTALYPHVRLVTCGMAELPMHVPLGWSDTPYAELSIALPPHWPASMEAFHDERFYWPVRLLLRLARLPHENETFLWPGHTIHGDRSHPYAPDTELCSSLIMPPMTAPRGFAEFTAGPGRPVRIFSVLPLYMEELDVKLRYGLPALLDLIGGAGLSDVVSPHRPRLGSRRSRPARRARRSTRAS